MIVTMNRAVGSGLCGSSAAKCAGFYAGIIVGVKKIVVVVFAGPIEHARVIVGAETGSETTGGVVVTARASGDKGSTNDESDRSANKYTNTGRFHNYWNIDYTTNGIFWQGVCADNVSGNLEHPHLSSSSYERRRRSESRTGT